MINSNSKTLSSYEAHIQEYIDGTPQDVDGFVKDWIDTALSEIPLGGSVLELGSAFGRDADYIESKGYAVSRSDATKGFVELLQNQGHEARVLNAITDTLGGPYDMVFADAVLLHFTIEELDITIRKIRDSLNEKGIFACSLKQGTGNEWSSEKLGAPRFFQYWQSDHIAEKIQQAGFSGADIKSDPSGKWLHVIARS